MTFDPSLSDASSELSDPPSRLPSPPSGLFTFRSEFSQHLASSYPTPPSSQPSNAPSPRFDPDSSICSNSTVDDENGPPPAKRRKTADMRPRPTHHVDLEDLAQNSHSDSKNELDKLFKALRQKRKIVIVAGAGISVSAGIPDFRSSDGLFKSLKAEHNLKGSGKDLFDAAVYRDANSTSSFHQMVRNMSSLVKSKEPTPFHHLIARLAHEGRLLRLYSQNVDGLETSLQPLTTQVPLPQKAPWPKTVQLHGGLEKMVCTKCHTLKEFQPDLFDGPVPPECDSCVGYDQAREVVGKRRHGVGRLRPRMVLYNESNPDDEAIGAVARADMRTRPDAVIVVGTTLKIPGVRRITKEMCGIVRDRRDGLSVWINHDPAPSGPQFEGCWDLVVKGTADEIAGRAGLGRWNDVEESIEESSEGDLEKARKAGEPFVVIPSPMKQESSGTLEAVRAQNDEPDHLDEKVTAILSLQQQAKAVIHNPASKGRSIDKVLGPLPTKKTKTPPKKTSKATSTRKTPLPSSQAKATQANKKSSQTTIKSKMTTKKQVATLQHKESLKLHFKTSKASAAAAVPPNDTIKLVRSQPSTPSKKRAGGSGPAPVTPPRKGGAMEKVSPAEKRLNWGGAGAGASPGRKVHASPRKIAFPNLRMDR